MLSYSSGYAKPTKRLAVFSTRKFRLLSGDLFSRAISVFPRDAEKRQTRSRKVATFYLCPRNKIKDLEVLTGEQVSLRLSISHACKHFYFFSRNDDKSNYLLLSRGFILTFFFCYSFFNCLFFYFFVYFNLCCSLFFFKFVSCRARFLFYLISDIPTHSKMLLRASCEDYLYPKQEIVINRGKENRAGSRKVTA